MAERVVVLNYLLPRPALDFSYSYFFLPLEQELKFKILLNRHFAESKIRIVESVTPGDRFADKVFEVWFTAHFEDHIKDIESLFNAQGRIEKMWTALQTKAVQRIQDKDLLVALENISDLDYFYGIPIEEEKVSSIKFFEYSEKTHSLLNEAVTGYTRLVFREKKKKNPDELLLEKLRAAKELAMNLLRKSDTFSSLDKMINVVAQYTPIVKALYSGDTPSQAAS